MAYTNEMDYQIGKRRTEIVQLRVTLGSIGFMEEIRMQEYEEETEEATE